MKTKKRTRAQILDRLYELAHDIQTPQKYVKFDAPNKYITAINVLHKGSTMAEVRCLSCGEKYIREPVYRFRDAANYQCPNCGNVHVVRDVKNKLEEKRYQLILKTEEGFEFIKFSTYLQYNSNDDKWYSKDPERHINITTAGIFDRNSGFAISAKNWYRNESYRVLRHNSSDEKSAIFLLKDFTHSNVSEEECLKLLREGNEFYEQQKIDADIKRAQDMEKKMEAEKLVAEEKQREAERKKQEYEARRLADKRWMYEAKPVGIESLFHQPILYRLYSSPNGADATYLVGCAKCGVVEEVTGIDINAGYTCPHCGNKVDALAQHFGEYYNNETNQSAVIFENTNLDENDVLIRLFRYSCQMDSNGNIIKSCYERTRVFVGPKPSIYRKEFEGSRFEKVEENTRIYVPGRNDANINQSDEEIVEIVRNSCLKYSGLIDSWGFGKYKYNWTDSVPRMAYLNAWYVNPAIEIAMKSNLTYLTDYFIEHPDEMGKGNTLGAILNADSGFVKLISKMNPQYHVMKDMESLYRADNSMTPEIYMQIMQDDLNRNILTSLAERYDITYDKALRYLQAAYDHQCILKRETLSIWSDYLRMASALGINLDDKSKKFPTSLKKEHDIAAFAYRAVRIEMDAKAFAQQAEINKKYEFETDDMFVMIPQTPQEVIEEANAQNNCLRSYIERVKRGETVVAFVRKKAEPKKTFLSAEILNGELVQLKGWCNSDPRTPEIVKFMKEWAEARDIAIKC